MAEVWMRSRLIPSSVRAQCAIALARALEHMNPGVTIDQEGYVTDFEANLLPGVRSVDFEADLRDGAGSELDKKFMAAHSSSALVVNCFAPFRVPGMPLDIGRHRGLKIKGFEQKLSTG